MRNSSFEPAGLMEGFWARPQDRVGFASTGGDPSNSNASRRPLLGMVEDVERIT